MVYGAAATYLTWPLARLSQSYIFPRGSPDDILLVLWILAWDVHALATNPAALFGGNIMYPARDILAHSEHLLGTLPLFAPTYLVTGNPILALNLMLLASFVLCGLAMHALVWAWTKNTVAAYTAGLSFAFAPWRITGLNWPHLLSAQYLPLAVLGLERVIATPRPLWALVLAVSLSLQLLASYYLAHMVILAIVSFIAANLLAGNEGWWRKTSWAALSSAVIPAFGLFLLVSKPYLSAFRAGQFQRPNLNGQMLATLATFGQPGVIVRTFIGWGPSILAIVALGFVGAGRVPTRVNLTRTLALTFIFLVALAVSPGPAGLFGGSLSLYTLLEAVVPGFSLVRVPFRFGILASFAVSALAGMGAWYLMRTAPRWARRATEALCIACAISPAWVASTPSAKALPTRRDLAPAYIWLATNGQGAPLLELPMQERPSESGWQWDRAGARAMYFSTYHWLPLLNGYTGYVPPSALAVEEIAAGLPSTSALQALVDCTDLRWILLHRMGPLQARAWQTSAGLHFVGVFPAESRDDRLYEVMLRRSGPCSDSRFPRSDSEH